MPGPAGPKRFRQEGYETSVVPGRFFEDPRHFRLGFGAPPDVVERGLQAIGRTLDELLTGPGEGRPFFGRGSRTSP